MTHRRLIDYRHILFSRHLLGIALAVAVVSVLFSSVFLFREGHLIDGDYALYICQGQSLLDGTQQKILRDMMEMLNLSTYKYYSPLLYPWGFPMMLSVPIACFGIDYVAFKILLYLCLLFSFFVLYRGFRKQEEESIGVWVLLLMGLNFQLSFATDWVISTLPFMTMLIIALYLIRGFDAFVGSLTKRLLRGVLLGATFWGCLMTRTEGVLLLPAFAVVVLLRLREYRKQKNGTCPKRIILVFAIPYFTVFLLKYLLWNILPSGEMIHFSHFGMFVWKDIWMKFLFYLYEGALCCIPFFCHLHWMGVVFFWSFVLLGGFVMRRKYVAEIFFLIFLLCLLAVWPYPNTRYIIPATPVLLLFFVSGVLYGVRNLWLSRGVLAICVFANLISLLTSLFRFDKRYSNYEKNIEDSNAQEVFKFLREHTLPTDVIGCCESRTIYLYTGRLSCNLFASMRDTAEKADWYVYFKHRGNYLQHEEVDLRESEHLFEKAYDNSDFVIYRVKKASLWENIRMR